MKDLKDGIRSHVRIDFKGHVHKKFRGHEKEQRCENEAHILRALEERECPYVPRLLDYDPDECKIVTTNCGQPAPGISRTKSDALFAELEAEYGVRHDDPEPRNVTYSAALGRFCLIDFELAELLPLPTGAINGPAGVWKISWSALSERGSKHPANDDAFLALEVGPSGARRLEHEGEALMDPSHLVLAVSDGMGGGSAGELASRLILAWMRKHSTQLYDGFRTNEEDTSPLIDILVSAHEGLNELGFEDPGLKGMGATLTLAWLSPGRLNIGHIGDSRLYLCRENSSKQLTIDHTNAWRDWQAGKISEFAYRNHPRRSALYDVLGAGHAHIVPQVVTHPLKEGDRLLLCTDGVIDGLWERPLNDELNASEPPHDVAEALLKRACENDGKDDATLIVADVRQI